MEAAATHYESPALFLLNAENRILKALKTAPADDGTWEAYCILDCARSAWMLDELRRRAERQPSEDSANAYTRQYVGQDTAALPTDQFLTLY